MNLQNGLRKVAAMVLLSAGLVVLPSLPANAAVPPTNFAPVALTDLTGPDYLLTHADGGATVGCNTDGSAAFRSFAASGTVLQSRAKSVNPSPWPCAQHMAVGADGTLFVVATVPTTGAYRVQAIKTGAVKWTYSVPCGGQVRAIVVGAGGNVNVLLGDVGAPCVGPSRLVSFKPTSATSAPVRVFDRQVAGNAQYGGLAYHDGGLVVLSATGVQYVSNAGTVSAASTIDYWGYGYQEMFGAVVSSGRVFLPLRTAAQPEWTCAYSGTYNKSLAAYGPGGFQWSYALPQCSTVYEIRPLPQGGVVFHVRYPFGGVPGEDVLELIALDASGNLRWRRDMRVPSDNEYNHYSYAFNVDLNGNVAVQYNVKYQEYIEGWSYVFPAVRFELLSGFSGIRLHSFELAGDRTSPEGLGYQPTDAGGEVRIAKNTVYVTADTCTGNYCPRDNTKLYALTVPGLQVDYPRGRTLVAAPVPVNYAALGDSFSSGEGVPPFIGASDANGCHRSTRAYAALLDAMPNSPVKFTTVNGRSSFVACSGATTATVASGQNGESSQLDVLDANTRVVTLTVGGNDIGFADFATACVLNLHCDQSSEYDNALYRIANTLPSALDSLYGRLGGRIGSQTKVLVLGYPLLVPHQDLPIDPSCGYLAREEKIAAREVVTLLNAAIQEAVTRINDSRPVDQFEYIDPQALGSLFQGHELCTQEPYFTGLSGNIPSTFHPNAKGQDAYSRLVEAQIS